jgi:putative nucleotidyltransferase with HDIG domain
MVFNFGNQLLAAMAYLTLLNSGIIDFSTLPQLGKVIYTVVSAMIVYAITTVDVAEAISLNMGVSIRKVWKEQFSWLYPYYAALGLIAFALIFTFESEGWIGIIVLLVPLFLLRLGQMQYIQRTTEMVGELRKKNAILEERAEEITGLTDDLLNALAQVIDLHNPYVLGHSEQVTRYATLTAQKIGLGPERIELVRKASLLHDIGKLGIPDQILMKPSTLLPEERQTIQKHVLLGAKILGKAKSIKSMVPIVRHHHERFDGKGYPDKLKAQEIPLEARILAVADAVEAMASDRPYRKALSLEEIISEIRRNAGTQFDPQVVEAFIKVMHEEGENLIVNSARNPQFSQDLVAATQLQLENGV